ncbi:hypothetical protein HHI36_012740 [Cryptolaemus montrouzieri]|uniref:RING-type domain-containing protein n=1 Tax=Cryptolaemus montrouzieri TaxID=559131 RepID=A0ABD2NGJ9_9CUCU
MNLEDKFHLLSNCEDELICFVCEDWCKDPVRLGKCGHYFCSICLPNYDYSCPKCKELFFKEDVSTAHWYGEVRQSVEYFKTILEPLLENLEKLKNTDKDENTQADLPFRIKFADPKSFKKNAKGESNLHLACKRKNIQQVKRLIEDNVDINSKDYACWTPLHEAIQAESIDIVIQLLNSGALINSVGEFYVTPLHKAVLMENSAIISILLENGASKDEIDFYGRKPEDCTKRQDLLEALNEGKPKENIEKPHVFLMNKVMVYCHSIDEEYRKKIVSSKNIRICKDFNIKINN